jgi:hypothetical protein
MREIGIKGFYRKFEDRENKLSFPEKHNLVGRNSGSCSPTKPGVSMGGENKNGAMRFAFRSYDPSNALCCGFFMKSRAI